MEEIGQGEGVEEIRVKEKGVEEIRVKEKIRVQEKVWKR